MKKLTDEEKKKRKSTIGKIIAFIVIIAISIACSKYNFVDMGHDFFMRILSVATGQSVEEPVNTLPPTEQSEGTNTEESSTDESSTEEPDKVEQSGETDETDEGITQNITTETNQTTTE